MSIDRKSLHTKLHYLLILLLAFAVPLSKKVVPPLIILLVLNWLIQGRFKEKFVHIRRWPYAVLFIAFYLMHVAGLLYSSNMDFGIFDLEIKLSLFVFPLLFSTSERFNPSQLFNVFVSFLIGCFTALAICLGRGIYRYSKTEDINSFLYSELSFFHHPTYFAMFLCLAICIMLYYLFNKKMQLVKYQTVVIRILIPLFSVFIILLNAKTGLICLAIMLVAAFFYLLLVEKKYIQGLVLFMAALLLAGSLYWVAPLTFGRLQWAVQVLFEQVEPDSKESTAGRLRVWPVVGELIQENPIFGVGTGDIKDELIKKYEEKNLSGVLAEKLNAHNQFLQSFAALGLIGFLILIAGILLPLAQAIKRKKFVYVFFLLIIVINSLTESILEVQAGVVFYAFFNSFFMFLDSEE